MLLHHLPVRSWLSRPVCVCRARHFDVMEWLLLLNSHDDIVHRKSYGDKVRVEGEGRG